MESGRRLCRISYLFPDGWLGAHHRFRPDRRTYSV